jgi:hypothetical protein
MHRWILRSQARHALIWWCSCLDSVRPTLRMYDLLYFFSSNSVVLTTLMYTLTDQIEL